MVYNLIILCKCLYYILFKMCFTSDSYSAIILCKFPSFFACTCGVCINFRTLAYSEPSLPR